MKRNKMIMVLASILILAVALAAHGCKKSDHEIIKDTDILYFRDLSTNLCFALLQSDNNYDSFRSFISVPCEAIENHETEILGS